jgi:phosphatidylglycerophosphatase A
LTTVAKILATWFYCGLSPAPGTVGTLGALIPALILHYYVNFQAASFLELAIFALFPGIWAADVMVHVTKTKDPQIVVIDEVIGMWLTLGGVVRFNWVSWIAAFVVFRALDIVKPPPIRAFERLPGGTGIIADDVAAGALGALVMFAAGWFNLY